MYNSLLLTNNMTLYEFNSLEFNDKMEVVNNEGTFLDNYVTTIERLNCYAVDRFFVEVVYDAERNTITEIRSFKTGQSLDKYSPKL